MKTLLLTGFEPFLDYPLNPTMEVVEALAGEVINGYRIEGEILPVDFALSGPALLTAIERVQPRVVISLGLAGGRGQITPERIAINCSDGAADNQGKKMTNAVIYPDGADGIFTTLPIEQMVADLRAAMLPAAISNSAGTYLCNNVMYHALHMLQQTGKDVPAGFIHIPPSHELAVAHPSGASWSQADLTEAIRICIEAL